MLRNYKKKASLNPWCIKSSLFSSLSFNTPEPLRLFETEPLGYVSICSKFINLASFKTLSNNDVQSLTNMLSQINYWTDLGFDENVEKGRNQSKARRNEKEKNNVNS